MGELQAELQRLSGTTLDAQGAANVWAGTSGLDLVGALNFKAGTSGLELNGVCNVLAGTTNLDAQGALSLVPLMDPLLAEAVVLLRVSSLDIGTYTPGDPWPNEGTGGSDYDADPFGAVGGEPSPPELGSTGFALGGGSETFEPVRHFEVPNGAEIDAGAGSFTWASKVVWPAGVGVFDPVAAKLTGTVGVDADGWIIATGTALGPGTAAVVADNPAYVPVVDAGALTEGEHIVAIRVDRSEATVDLFIDGELVATADPSTVASTTSTNPIIIGRSTQTEVVHIAGIYWNRVLTDTEITVDLPAALEVA